MKIAVIGSGIAGLSVAVRLRSAGHDVTVYEKNNTVGGKISQIKKAGFTWDGGPSFFTDPAELKKLFNDVGKDVEDYFKYRSLDEVCRYFYPNAVLRAYDEPVKLAAEFKRVFGEDPNHVIRFLQDAQTIYTNTGLAYLDHPFSIRRILSPKLMYAFLKTPKRATMSSMARNHQTYFDTDEARQFFDRFATYTGSDPSRAPGLLSCTPHLEHNIGAFQPVGGMRSIIVAVLRLARELGVVFKADSPVSRLLIERGAVTGVIVDGLRIRYDRVVNAGDVASIMRWHQKKAFDLHDKREHSSSAVVLYLGVKKSQVPIYLHNIFFSTDYAQETRALWQSKLPYEDPTIYINNTSYYDKNHAPSGCQNWFVMANAPAGMSDEDARKVRSFMLAKLSRVLKVKIQDLIITEAPMLTPSVLEAKFSAHKGSIYGLAGNSWRGAFFRPPNIDKKFKHLYHCGVTTHPGGGIPLALRSARIVSSVIG